MLGALERHMARGEWLQAKREAERLMMCRVLSTRDLAQIYGLSGKACVELGEYPQAIAVLKLACQYAETAAEWDMLGRARGNLGVAYLSTGDYDAAWECWREFLADLARYTSARRFEGRIHYNIGLVYRYRGEYDTAAAAYLQAMAKFEEAGDKRDAADCQQNLGYALCLAGNPQLALPYIVAAETQSESFPPDFTSQQLLLRALYYRQSGNLKASLSCVSELLAPGRLGVTLQQRAEADWILGLIAWDEGDLAECERRARSALSLASESRFAPLIRCAQDLLAQVMAAR